MKTSPALIAIFVTLTSIHSYAIEGLKIRVQNSNVILSWASTNTETYIVQSANNLSSPITWTTLADLYPAASATNITYFTNFNSVIYAPSLLGDGGGGGDISPLDEMSESTPAFETATIDTGEIMAMPINGQTDEAVPLKIYPIGFDLSNFTIFNSLTGESVSGNNYVVSSPSFVSEAETSDFETMDSGFGSGVTNLNAGFYRVVRDGVHVMGLTNGAVLSGIVKMAVELGNTNGTVTTLSLTENETPVGNSIQSAPSITPMSLIVDTTQMSNGIHQVSASATWEDTNGGIWEVSSPIISISVSNEISYPNWMPAYGELGNTVLFRATSAHTNTDWIVYVYDDHTNYLGYFNGHTYDGDISFYWDYSGTPYTNSQNFSFEIATEYVDPPAPPTYKQTDPWTATGAWAIGIQHAFDYITDHETLYEEFGGFTGAAGSNGGVKPPKDDSGNPYAISFQTPDEATYWATFRTALYDTTTRNFIYFGHGGPSGIGYNSHDTNVFITATEIANKLHTIPSGQTNRHAFRFVFLDGCSTGKGMLPDAFGILHKLNVPSIEYYNASLRPSCFVGWSAVKYVGFIGGSAINYYHVNFISHIQLAMLLNGATISDAISYAASQPDVTGVATSELLLYGCTDVTFGAFNN